MGLLGVLFLGVALGQVQNVSAFWVCDGLNPACHVVAQLGGGTAQITGGGWTLQNPVNFQNGTNGNCVCEPGDRPCPCSATEPMDVPAVQEMFDEVICTDPVGCPLNHTEKVKRWTCSDKSRVLLTAEDGTRHCIKFTR